MGPYLIGLYLMGPYLMGLYQMAFYQIGLYLMGLDLMEPGGGASVAAQGWRGTWGLRREQQMSASLQWPWGRLRPKRGPR